MKKLLSVALCVSSLYATNTFANCECTSADDCYQKAYDPYGYCLGECGKQFCAKACDFKNVNACFDLANHYIETIPGNATAEEEQRILALSLEYSKKACELNDAMSCNSVALAYKNGDGVVVDNNEAIKYFDKACKLNYNSGCTNSKELKDSMK